MQVCDASRTTHLPSWHHIKRRSERKHWLSLWDITGFNFRCGRKRESYLVMAVNHYICSRRLLSPATSSVWCDSVMWSRRRRRIWRQDGWASSTVPYSRRRAADIRPDIRRDIWRGRGRRWRRSKSSHVEIDRGGRRLRLGASLRHLYRAFNSHGERCGNDGGAWQSNSTVYQKFPNPAEYFVLWKMQSSCP